MGVVRRSARRSLVLTVLAGLLLAGLALPASAAFPGANGKLAYTAWRDGQARIFVANSDGTSPRDLGAGFGPVWSPDGKQLAYTRWCDPLLDCWGQAGVAVVNIDGTGRRTVRSRGGDPSWSPDGKRFAYHELDANGAGQIYLINLDGTGRTKLTAGWNPAWAPRSSLIAYANDVNLFTIRTDGTGRRQLTSHDPRMSWSAFDPDWSPDGSRLVYTEGGSACSIRLVTAKPDGTDKRRLDSFPGCNMYDPSWSPDGRTLAFVTDWLQPTDGGGAYTIRPDGSALRRLPIQEEIGRPSWQPVAFATSLTTTVSATAITHGAPVTVSGKLLRSGTTTGVPSRPVVLEIRPPGTTTWTRVKSTTTRTGGAYSFTHEPTRITEYRVRHVASNGWPAATGPTRRVDVATKVTGTLNSATIPLGGSVTMKGSVAPGHAGQPVRLQQQVSGSWQTIATKSLSSTSTYSFTIKPTTKGTLTYRVVKPADADHTLGRSPKRTLTVQ
jgi:Tol biopolymer transport system component